MVTSTPRLKPGGRRALVLAGLVLAALNFRPAFTSVSPVLETVRQDLSLDRAAASLLTTIPVLCMGVFAFGAARIVDRVGLERAVLWTMVLIGIATAGRLAGDAAVMLFATTVLVGIGIAVGQALLPAVVKRYFPDRAALVTGLYTVGFNAGAAVAAGATVALESAFGGSWPAALAFWALLALPAAAVWSLAARGSPGGARQGEVTRSSLPWRSPLAWLLGLYFAATSCLYWSVLTWLAPLYQDEGLSKGEAGFLLTLFTFVQIFAAIVVPVLADRSRDRRPWLALMLVMMVAGLTSIAVVPLATPWGFTALIGFGIGGLFPLVLTFPLDYSPNPDAANRLTSMMLGVGYLISAVGPFAIGALRDATGSYWVPFAALAALSITMLAGALLLRTQSRAKPMSPGTLGSP